MNYYPLEKLINLYDGYRQVFIVERQEVLLIQEEGRRYALQGACPHRHWPLQNAPVKGETITCGKHGWAFNLNTGNPESVQADCALKVFPIHYHENTIGICLD